MTNYTPEELAAMRQDLRDRKYSITPAEAEGVIAAHGFEQVGNNGSGHFWQRPGGAVRIPVRQTKKNLDPAAVLGIANTLDGIALDDAAKLAEAAQRVPLEIKDVRISATVGAYEKDGKITVYDLSLPVLSQSFEKKGDVDNQIALNATRLDSTYVSVRDAAKEAQTKYLIRIEDNGETVRISQPDLLTKDYEVSRSDPRAIEIFSRDLTNALHTAETEYERRFELLVKLEEAGLTYKLVHKEEQPAAETPISEISPHVIVPVYGSENVPIIPREPAAQLKKLLDDIAKVPDPVLTSVEQIAPPVHTIETARQPTTPDPVVVSATVPSDVSHSQEPLVSKQRYGVSHLPTTEPRHPMLRHVVEGENAKLNAKADIILDATSLNLMATRVDKEGRSLIGILPHIANLPTINRVVIPSSAADWSLRGLVPHEDGLADVCSDLKLKQAYEHNSNFSELNYIVNNATRLRYDKDGRLLEEIPGAFKNIVVFDSAAQRSALMPQLEIHNASDAYEPDKEKKIEELRKKYDIDGNDSKLSKEAIAEYIGGAAIGKAVAAYVVTDDKSLLSHFGRAIQARSRKLGRTSGDKPVSALNTAALINALGNDYWYAATAFQAMRSDASSDTSTNVYSAIKARAGGRENKSGGLKNPIEYTGKDFLGHRETLGQILSEGAASAAGKDTTEAISVCTSAGAVERTARRKISGSSHSHKITPRGDYTAPMPPETVGAFVGK